MYAVLIIDDEDTVMEMYSRLLERRTFRVRRSQTTADAMKEYNRQHYDLIVIDVSMPPGPLFSPHDPKQGNYTGLLIYKEIRSHLPNIPIIIFTNLPIPNILNMLEHHDRTIVLSKGDTPPTALAEEVASMINKYPTRSDDFAGSNDEIDEIKYFIRENGTNRSIPVCFQVVDLSDLEPFDQHWALSSFFEVFKQCMDESDMRRFTWKLVRNDGGDNDIHGIFYSGGLSAEWFLDALLEAAPWNVHGSTERRFRWVGKVLVARFIRESQVRGMSGEFAIHVGTAGEFFARLGFKPLKQSSKVYYITLERATDLLKEVGTE